LEDSQHSGALVAVAAVLITTSVPQQQLAMTMDHPFLYAIRDDDTGALLFFGTFLDPSK
jgi:serine protease inhibitor